MIAVIADDLTGAAELGGIGLRYGLSVEISLSGVSHSQADLLIFAADTRSQSVDQAVNEMKRLSVAVASLKTSLIFKKVDSVLRGHVLPELNAQLATLNLDRALLVPANPALGRTIENGVYLINGMPIAETSFSKDPEFPAGHSDVNQLLHADTAVSLKNVLEPLPMNGIIVGEVKTEADLESWAERSEDTMLLAGGSGFFRAILKGLYESEKLETGNKELTEGSRLYVFGSAFKKSADLVHHIKSIGGPVFFLPMGLPNDPRLPEEYFTEIENLMTLQGKVILAVDPKSITSQSAFEIRTRMAVFVKKFMERISVSELLIEGGSTAAAIINSLEIDTLVPINEFSTGVIRSRAWSNLNITLKPGSYDWPEQLLTF